MATSGRAQYHGDDGDGPGPGALRFVFDEDHGYSPWEHPVRTRGRIVAFFRLVGAVCGVDVEDLARGEHVAQVASVRVWAELERRLVAAGFGVRNAQTVFVVDVGVRGWRSPQDTQGPKGPQGACGSGRSARAVSCEDEGERQA